MKVNNVGKMACPTGFEPVTCCLEGNGQSNKINGNSNINYVCSLFRPVIESITYKFVGIFSGVKLSNILCALYLISFLVCCIIAVALTEIRGHVKLGSLTLAYNETTQEYVQASLPYSSIMMEGSK